jgi:hypothetical protein
MAWTSGAGLADVIEAANPRITKLRTKEEAKYTGLVYGTI